MMRFILFLLCLTGFAQVSGQKMTEFEQLVEELRLDENVVDLSDSGNFSLDEPRLAYANLTGISTMPRSKHITEHAWLEVYDGAGHYFRKRILIHGQGGYSLRYPKNNASFTFCEDNWKGELTTDIRFGDWVKQDGFHLKAFYTDFCRGIGEIGYKVFARMVEDRVPYWERGGYMDGSRARCFPDGFPCILYLNGKFHGIYAWQLKKHRKNMNMEKYEATHIHLDGNLNNTSLFRGYVNWKQFEVRNPKNLYTASGYLYDGNYPEELMGEQSSQYALESDSEDQRQAKQRSAQVKAAILRLSNYHKELENLQKSGAGVEEIKARFEECFDLESLIDYAIFFYYSANGDGSLKNWQWFTYDGKKWMVTPYDLDQCFGLGLYGQIRPSYFPIETLTSGPFYWLNAYYQNEICQRWQQLRQSGVLTDPSLIPIADDWYTRIGDGFYLLERQHWPLSPCYCEPICNANWEPYDNWKNYRSTPDYSNKVTYVYGDVVKLEGRLWMATDSTTNVEPFIRNATPDSIQRLETWLSDRIIFLDTEFGYVEYTGISRPALDGQDTEVVAVYTLSGIRVEHPSRGIYIFRYRNGLSKKVLVR